MASQEDRSRLGTQGGAVLYLPITSNSRAFFVKFYYVYILHNPSKNFLYVRYSEDVKKRYVSHNKGENKSTKAYVPLELVHYEAYKCMSDAKRREVYLKPNRGRTTLMTMLKEYFKNVEINKVTLENG